MKISNETKDILKNFAGINSNLLIPNGETIRTISPEQNIMATVQVSEQFPKEVGIWDLNEFLGTLSLFNSPTVEMKEKYFIIKEGKKSVRYFYTNTKLLQVIKKDIKFPESCVSFTLNEKNLKELKKAAGVMALPNFVFKAEKGSKTIDVIVTDKSNSTSNNYSLSLPANEIIKSDGGELCCFKVENFKMISDDYVVDLSDKKISRFVGKNKKVTYYIAMEI